MPKQLEDTSPDKATFLVGLSAAVLALYPFQSTAQQITIEVFNFSWSVYELAGVFILLLLLAAYLYGLNAIRYEISNLLNIEFLKYFEFAAHFLYFLAFSLPLLLLLLWVISFTLGGLLYFVGNISDYLDLLSGIIGLIFGVIVSIASARSYLTLKHDVEAELGEYSRRSLEQEKIWYGKKEYNEVLRKLYKACIYMLRATLVSYVGIGVKKLHDSEAIRIAWSKKVITSEEANFLKDVRNLMHQAPYSETLITTGILDGIYTQSNQLIKRLQDNSKKDIVS